MCSVIVKLCISQEKSINRLGQLVRGLRGEAQGKNKNHLLLVVATIGRELMATFEGDWWQQLHFYELFSSCICIFVTVKSEESKWVYKNTRFKKTKTKQDLYLKKCLFFCLFCFLCRFWLVLVWTEWLSEAFLEIPIPSHVYDRTIDTFLFLPLLRVCGCVCQLFAANQKFYFLFSPFTNWPFREGLCAQCSGSVMEHVYVRVHAG